ncbi:MAG: TetR/AcrR family transcriptional regulator [Paracoccaceae bacterium]
MARKTGSHSDLTRPRIRAAALTLFARHGYAAVTMRQIAAEVGVQAGALYLYTPDKQSLLFDLLKAHMDELLAAWAGVPPEAEPAARLEAFVRFHIRFNLVRPEAVFLSYMELRNLAPDNLAAIAGLRKSYEDSLAAILAEGQAQGRFTIADLRLATMAIIAMLTGIATWYREGGRLSLDRVERIYWNMVRRLVKA